MAGTTANGLPYPESTDFVTDGAQAIQDLAEEITDIYPRGKVAFGESTTTPAGFTAETITVAAITFTAVANRYYKVTYYEPDVFQNTAATVTARVRLNNVTGTVQAIMADSDASNNVITPLMLQFVKTFTAGSVTLVATLQVGAGAIQPNRATDKRAFLLVEDIGL